MGRVLCCMGVLLLGSFLWGACATGQISNEHAQVLKKIGQLQRYVQKQDARIESLSNRIFVLADRVDSAQVESTRLQVAHQLEVVKLAPTPMPMAPPTNIDPEPLQTMPDENEEEPLVIQMTDNGELEVVSGSGSSSSNPHSNEKRLSVHELPPPLKIKPTGRMAKLADAEKIFQSALNAYQDGKLNFSYQKFSAFVHKFRHHDYADNALFWMGVCRYDAKAYLEAISEFAAVVKNYPRSNKIPDALFKIGLAYERLGESQKAKQAFQDVIRNYPRSAIADLARSHLPISESVGE